MKRTALWQTDGLRAKDAVHFHISVSLWVVVFEPVCTVVNRIQVRIVYKNCDVHFSAQNVLRRSTYIQSKTNGASSVFVTAKVRQDVTVSPHEVCKTQRSSFLFLAL